MTRHLIMDSIKDTSNNAPARLAVLHKESFAAGQRLAGNPDTFEYDDPDIDGWKQEIAKLGDNRHIRAIFNDKGGMLAFAHFGRKENDPDTAELYSLYVSPDHWNEGLGSELFYDATFILKQKKCKTLLVEVGDDEPYPIKFYENKKCVHYKDNSDGGEILTRTLKHDLS